MILYHGSDIGHMDSIRRTGLVESEPGAGIWCSPSKGPALNAIRSRADCRLHAYASEIRAKARAGTLADDDHDALAQAYALWRRGVRGVLVTFELPDDHPFRYTDPGGFGYCTNRRHVPASELTSVEEVFLDKQEMAGLKDQYAFVMPKLTPEQWKTWQREYRNWTKRAWPKRPARDERLVTKEECTDMIRWTLTIVVAIALTGCGGDTTTAPSQSSAHRAAPSMRPTKVKFITRADAICSEMHRKLGPWQRRANATNKLGAMLAPAERIEPLAHELSRRLDALPLPADDAQVVEHYRALVRRQADDITRLVDALRNRDVAAVIRLSQRNSSYIARQRGIAEGLGMKVCGRSE